MERNLPSKEEEGHPQNLEPGIPEGEWEDRTGT